jgi:hypothetical protein
MQIGAPGAPRWGPFSGSSGNNAWKQCKRPAAMFYSRRYGLRLPGQCYGLTINRRPT